MEDIQYVKAAEILKVIAHPVRLKIIMALKTKKMSVSDIQCKLKIKQSITSQHLNNMKAKGILQAQREGNIVYYSILNKSILKILSCIQACKS